MTAVAVGSAMAGVLLTDIAHLIPALAAAYGIVLGAVVVRGGWGLFSRRAPGGYRRNADIPPVGGIGPGTDSLP